MPNFNLVSNAVYKPMTFAEASLLYKPYDEAYKASEQELKAANEQASILAGLIKESDGEIYNQVQDYMKALDNQASILSTEGLNSHNRSTIMGLKSRYNREMLPIETGYAARTKAIQDQAAGRAKGVVYETDAATTSLADFVNNPNLTFRSADTTVGYQRLRNAADAISQQLRGLNPNVNINDPYTLGILQTLGYKDGNVHAALQDLDKIMSGQVTPNDNNKILRYLLEGEMKAAGISDWSEASKRDYMNAVSPALWDAVGTGKFTTRDNYGARLAAKEAAEKKGEEPERFLPRGREIKLYRENEYREPAKIIANKLQNNVSSQWTTMPAIGSSLAGVINYPVRTSEEKADESYLERERQYLKEARELLIDYGYPKDKVDKMTRDAIMANLNKLSNGEGDVMERIGYGYRLKDAQGIIDMWDDQPGEDTFKEITRTTSKGYNYGRDVKLSKILKGAKEAQFITDPLYGKVMLVADGKRYEVPASLLGDLYSDSFRARSEWFRGEGFKKYQEIAKKYNSGDITGLTLDDFNYYKQESAGIEKYNRELENAVLRLNWVVGTDNLNG